MSWLDWVVLAGFGIMMLAVGWYFESRNKSADDYLLGGRRMSPLALGLSLFATLVSTLSYLGTPGEMIGHGPMMITAIAAHPIIFLIVGYGLIPYLMKQPVTSAYELLESRLGMGIRQAGAGIFLLLRFGWMATILFATSKVVLVPLLNLDPSWIPWLCTGLAILTATYSSWGGIKAVVATDAIQSVTMLAGALLTLLVVTVRMGGVDAWWPNEWPEHWQTPSWGFDPEARVSFGVLMLSNIVWYVCTNGSDQMSVQRFLSTRDASAARQTMAVAQVADATVASLLALTGVAVLGFYRVNPPALADGQTLASLGDELFPRFIMNEMPPGLSGLVLSAILSAALSSMSSGVNSTCAVLDRDFVAPLFGLREGGEQAVRRLRWMTWGVSLLAIGLAMLNVFLTGNLMERCYKLINLLTAPLFSLFFLALFVRWANPRGAWLGLLSSSAVAIAIGFAKELSLPITISFVWMMPCSLLTGIVVGVVSSYLLRSPEQR